MKTARQIEAELYRRDSWRMKAYHHELTDGSSIADSERRMYAALLTDRSEAIAQLVDLADRQSQVLTASSSKTLAARLNESSAAFGDAWDRAVEDGTSPIVKHAQARIAEIERRNGGQNDETTND